MHVRSMKSRSLGCSSGAYACRAPQVRATIKAGSRGKRAVAGALLGASLAHVRARRLTGGVDLRYARQPPPALAVMWAVAVAAATYPLHRWAGGGTGVGHGVGCRGLSAAQAGRVAGGSWGGPVSALPRARGLPAAARQPRERGR